MLKKERPTNEEIKALKKGDKIVYNWAIYDTPVTAEVVETVGKSSPHIKVKQRYGSGKILKVDFKEVLHIYPHMLYAEEYILNNRNRLKKVLTKKEDKDV